LGGWERLIVKCDRGAAYGSECECAVNGFGFIEFESPILIPCKEHVKVDLDLVGCFDIVMVEG